MKVIWRKRGEIVDVRSIQVGQVPAGGAWTELHVYRKDLEHAQRILRNGDGDKMAQWLQDMLVRNVAPEPLPEGAITKHNTEA